jgi:hypothetical protein
VRAETSINLNLGESKVESLMRQTAIHAKESKQEPIVKGLESELIK